MSHSTRRQQSHLNIQSDDMKARRGHPSPSDQNVKKLRFISNEKFMKKLLSLKENVAKFLLYRILLDEKDQLELPKTIASATKKRQSKAEKTLKKYLDDVEAIYNLLSSIYDSGVDASVCRHDEENYRTAMRLKKEGKEKVKQQKQQALKKAKKIVELTPLSHPMVDDTPFQEKMTRMNTRNHVSAAPSESANASYRSEGDFDMGADFKKMSLKDSFQCRDEKTASSRSPSSRPQSRLSFKSMAIASTRISSPDLVFSPTPTAVHDLDDIEDFSNDDVDDDPDYNPDASDVEEGQVEGA